ncbi:hypothetical protein COCOBI_13-0240 [Coccomyxa sp. Obi]|nr:hypothetical protein COCOBI_13-0240 [Coccomyxa sp. Obi]
MAIAFTAEHADTMVVSALYLPIGRSLDVSVSKLGELSMWRGIITAIIVPFVGVVGNMSNRIYLITVGALIWAGMSTAFGLSTTYSEAS